MAYADTLRASLRTLAVPCAFIVQHIAAPLDQPYLHFEKENIDTSSAYSEMLMTVLAAFAQEETIKTK